MAASMLLVAPYASCLPPAPTTALLPAKGVLSWDAGQQGQFVLSLCRDLQGNTWVGTEGQGVWRFQPAAPTGKQWTQFTEKDGLGDDNGYALTCDKKGRVWAGTLNHGVSVYNGKAWKTYGSLDGPLGSRTFALAVSPKDGGVWGATEAGLFRYQSDHWTYYTRAEGLPSDQASALAFAADGTLYVGTLCNGIAIGSPDDNYRVWHVVSGPTQLPNAATGYGLPTVLINCLLVAQNDTVYAGTTCGLAISRDGNQWVFLRGADWKAKQEGLTYPVAAPAAVPVNLLREDYVTCLAEDEAGRIWVAHRQGGAEAFDPKKMRRVQSGANGEHADSYVNALLTCGQTAWVGLYGGGLLPPPSLSTMADAATPAPIPTSPLPTPAAPPTLAELRAMQARVEALKEPLPVGGGAYLGEDWATQGDWVGRYGIRYAVLCADAAPLDQYVLSDFSYQVAGYSGPHHAPGDGMRSWCHWVKTDDPRVLWDPLTGYRREAEWDDHGETYSSTFQGPDVWATVSVPAGLHRLSLYLMNKDGHEADNSQRDYLVELKAWLGDGSGLDTQPALATARAHDFWGGVYERFLVRGPGRFAVKVGRNYSKNATLQSVFLDKVSGPPTRYETRRSIWYGNTSYQPPALPTEAGDSSVTVTAARNLWAALDSSADRQDAERLTPEYRLLAYRSVAATAVHEKTSAALAANWHWQLCLWSPDDRTAFQQAMKDLWQYLLAINPKLAKGNQ